MILRLDIRYVRRREERSSYERDLGLKKTNCKSCHKCIRNCAVKSIRFTAGQAHIVEDECITVRALFCRLSAGCESHRKRYGKSQDHAADGHRLREHRSVFCSQLPWSRHRCAGRRAEKAGICGSGRDCGRRYHSEKKIREDTG